MLRCLLCGTIAAFALGPAALADGAGPSSGVLQGSPGVLGPGGHVRYIALGGRPQTTITAVRTKDGKVLSWTALPGSWGVPLVTYSGSAGGVSADGRTLVLAKNAVGRPLRSQSVFRVLDAKTLQLESTVALRGDFAFDALSPHGRMLYLIQHVSATNLTHYVVRAYDLDRGRLLPGRIADRTQRGWVMQGYPTKRVTSAGGRWVYTLYQNPGGYPFVHALDTVRGVAHCIGIPWTGDQGVLLNLRLSLREEGRTLALAWKNGRSFLAIDTRTYRIERPGAGASSFPWWALGLGLAAALALIGVAVTRVTRRRAPQATPLRA